MMVMMMMENVVYIFLWVLIDWVSQLGNFSKKINCMLIERERERENPRCFY